MKKIKGFLVYILFLCLLVSCNSKSPDNTDPTGYASDEIEQPQIMYSGKIFYYWATGFNEELPDGYVYVGKVESVNNKEEPTKDFSGSCLEIGQKVFANDEKTEIIYVKYENGYACFSTELKESISDQTTVESREPQQENCIGIIVARAGDYEIYYFDSNNLTDLYIDNFENLRSLALRNKAGVSEILQTADDLVSPILNMAEEAITTDVIDKGYISSDLENSITWVRLLYNPYMPELGDNDQPHKDIVLAVTSENLENAFLIIQDPNTLTVWNYIKLEGYGQWLSREVDMLLAQTTGF